MKRYFLVIGFLLAFLVGPVHAQDAPTISNLEIALWPEFDRPEMLVIYQGTMAADTPLPVAVEFRIPSKVGAPTAVAYVGESGDRLNQQYTTRVEGDWLVVSFELATLGFQLEYYDALPVDAAGQREYTYGYVADYAIANLNLEFQVPPTAQGFALEPEADSTVQEADGLTYHLVLPGSVAQGTEQSWKLAYQKNNSELTVSAFVQPETAVPAAPEAENADGSTVLIFLIAFVALAAVGAGAFWLGRRTQPVGRPASPQRRQPKRRGSGRGGQPQARSPQRLGTTGALFCHRCGAQLRSDSEFCHMCGTVVRAE
jgi:hypothetical protein